MVRHAWSDDRSTCRPITFGPLRTIFTSVLRDAGIEFSWQSDGNVPLNLLFICCISRLIIFAALARWHASESLSSIAFLSISPISRLGAKRTSQPSVCADKLGNADSILSLSHVAFTLPFDSA